MWQCLVNYLGTEKRAIRTTLKQFLSNIMETVVNKVNSRETAQEGHLKDVLVNRLP